MDEIEANETDDTEMAVVGCRPVYVASGGTQMITFGKILNVTLWLSILVIVFCISAPFILIEWLAGRDGGHF